MILPDCFLDQDTSENMYLKAGLDSNSIEEKVLNTIKSNIILSKVGSKN
jgi:1-deoxy-D-xylulose-5-phosphate synthase